MLKMITRRHVPHKRRNLRQRHRQRASGAHKRLLTRNLPAAKTFTSRAAFLGLNDEDIAKLEPAIIDFAELEEYIDQPVRTYSSGMKARLGFSICVNINREILIVDEALSSATARSAISAPKKVKGDHAGRHHASVRHPFAGDCQSVLHPRCRDEKTERSCLTAPLMKPSITTPQNTKLPLRF